MRSFKIIVSIVLLVILTCSNTLATLSSLNSYESARLETIKQLFTARNDLSRKYGQVYVDKIDSIVEKLKDDPVKMNKLNTNLEKFKLKLKGNNSPKARLLISIIYYAENKILLESINKSILQLRKTEEEKLIILEEINNPSLSESEENLVNKKILNLQNHLFNIGSKNLNKWIEDYENLTNYVEKGDLNFSLLVEDELINLLSDLELKNYESINSGFDSRAKGDISFNMSGDGNGKALDIKVDSIFDLIAKDGVVYTLIEEFNSETSGDISEIQEYIDMMKKVATQNKYVAYNDKETALAYELINKFNPKKLLSEAKDSLSNPLFEAYKKEGNKYFLVPTKYTCDQLKTLLNKFDPFSPTKCSDSQYKNMIDEISESGAQIYLEVGNGNSSLSFGMQGKFKSNIVFSDSQIKELYFEAEDKGTNEDKFYIKAKFDTDYDISFLDLNTSSSTKYVDFSFDLNINNHEIDGEFLYLSRKYDYGNGTFKDKGLVESKISGKTNYDNSLKSLVIGTKGMDIAADKVNFNSDFIYNNGLLDFSSSYDDLGVKAEMSFLADWNKSKKMFDSFDFDVSVLTQESNFDYVTYEISYSGEYKEIFASDYSLDDGKISGNIKVSDGDNDKFNLSTSGEYKKKYLNLENTFSIYNRLSQNKGLFTGDLNFMIDKQLSKNNLEVSAKIIKPDGDNFATITLSNIGTIEYRTVDIKIPDDFIDYNNIVD